MKTTTRFTVQAILAGAVAGLVLLGARGLTIEAQDAPAEPTTTEETTTASAVPACDLVTETEAETALGTGVTRVADPAQCTYVATDASGRSASIARPPAAFPLDAFAAGMDQVASALNGQQRAVAAGDEAYAVLADVMSQVVARRGDQFVVVVLTNPAGTADEQAALLTDLATTALSRL